MLRDLRSPSQPTCIYLILVIACVSCSSGLGAEGSKATILSYKSRHNTVSQQEVANQILFKHGLSQPTCIYLILVIACVSCSSGLGAEGSKATILSYKSRHNTCLSKK